MFDNQDVKIDTKVSSSLRVSFRRTMHEFLRQTTSIYEPWGDRVRLFSKSWIQGGTASLLCLVRIRWRNRINKNVCITAQVDLMDKITGLKQETPWWASVFREPDDPGAAWPKNMVPAHQKDQACRTSSRPKAWKLTRDSLVQICIKYLKKRKTDF